MKRTFWLMGIVLVAASMIGCIGDRGLRSGYPAGGGYPGGGGYQAGGGYPSAMPSGGG